MLLSYDAKLRQCSQCASTGPWPWAGPAVATGTSCGMLLMCFSFAAEPSVAATFERGYDYTSPNPDLAAIPDRSLAQCAQACKDNSACYFFSSNQQNKMCYLKGKMNAIQKFGGDEWYTGSVVRGKPTCQAHHPTKHRPSAWECKLQHARTL